MKAAIKIQKTEPKSNSSMFKTDLREIWTIETGNWKYLWKILQREERNKKQNFKYIKKKQGLSNDLNPVLSKDSKKHWS